MSEFYINIIERQGERLIAVCDKEVINTAFQSHGVTIRPTHKFYGSELVSTDEVLEEIKKCTSANVIGKKIISLLIKHRWIHKDAVLWLEHPETKNVLVMLFSSVVFNFLFFLDKFLIIIFIFFKAEYFLAKFV